MYIYIYIYIYMHIVYIICQSCTELHAFTHMCWRHLYYYDIIHACVCITDHHPACTT